VQTWKLTLEYDGTKYSGWQEQTNARTVAGQLRKALEEFLGVAVEMQGAGRTDAGVHALAQVAHVRARTTARMNVREMRERLNDNLPAGIAVLDIEEMPARFHARHDAVSRCYVYQISTRKMAFSKRHVWWVKAPLDVQVMQRAAAMLEGRHDFVRFRAEDDSRPDESTIVVVEHASMEQHDDLILFRIEASHFLWRMVRRLAGTLVRLGKGELSLEQFNALLAGKAEKLKVSEWTAPASGLFLESVRYESLLKRRPS
jgi:tRNA pseudouridine38-40 synthase